MSRPESRPIGDGGRTKHTTLTGRPSWMKSARERMDMVNAYAELGSYRAAAAVCGTTHKTVKRIVERQRRGAVERPPLSRPKQVDGVTELIAERVRASAGRISAKRLLPVVRGAG